MAVRKKTRSASFDVIVVGGGVNGLADTIGGEFDKLLP